MSGVHTAGGVYIGECTVQGCGRSAETSLYINSPRGRGEKAVCWPCARAIRIGERSEELRR